MNSLSLAFISALSFYAIPAIIGSSFFLALSWVKKSIGKDADTENRIIAFFNHFIYGSIIIYVQFGLANWYLSKNSSEYLLSTTMKKVIVINVILWMILYLLTGFKIFAKSRKVSPKLIFHSVFFIIISAIAYTIWRYDSGISTTLNWDFYHHQTLANLIKNNHFSFLTSDLSDSFQFLGYSTIFHTLFALPQIIFNPNLLAYFWFLEAFHLLTTVAVSYTIAKTLSQNETVGLISAIIGAFIFESSVSYTSLFLIPQNLAALLVVIYIAKAIRERNQHEYFTKNLLTLDLIIFIIYIFLNHAVVGILGIFLVIFTRVFLFLPKVNYGKIVKKYIIYASYLLLILVPLLANYFDLNSLNRGEAAYFNFTLIEKASLVKTVYGYSFYIFIALGIYELLKQRNTKNEILMVIINGLFALLIASIPYNLKFYTIARFFIHTVMAIGIWSLIKGFNKFIKTVSIVLVLVFFIWIYVINVDTFKQVPSYKEISSHVTQSEIKAAEFLKQKYKNKNVILISEPATMHILEGLSGINTPGGAYTSLETRKTLTDIYLRRDSDLPDRIKTIRDSTDTSASDIYLFAITGRFGKWQLASDEQRYGIHWNVWKPADLSHKELEEYEFIFYLEEILGFKKVFENDGVIIFEFS